MGRRVFYETKNPDRNGDDLGCEVWFLNIYIYIFCLSIFKSQWVSEADPGFTRGWRHPFPDENLKRKKSCSLSTGRRVRPPLPT